MKTKITFPVWRIRNHTSIETKLGRTKIITPHNEYILDDTTYEGGLPKRRLKLMGQEFKLYPLYEKVHLYRQLIKYRTGTLFIDINGYIFKYIKSSKQYKVTSHKITNRKRVGMQTVFWIDSDYMPYTTELILDHIYYASIMHTKNGPLLYDFTNEYHETYRRKI